ncbi:hypothetical protein TNCV_3179971 [Trichonephila clavipes]|nr:hypothetical protein TNCV_3179971 [Trichonephila clavipes]
MKRLCPPRRSERLMHATCLVARSLRGDVWKSGERGDTSFSGLSTRPRFEIIKFRKSFEMRDKGGNRLVPGPDYMVDAVKLPSQDPRVSGESLHTCVTRHCPDGMQHVFCWPIRVNC